MTSKLLRVLKTDVRFGLLIPAVALSVLLLAGFAYLRWRPISAPHLNRVSFRLLVHAMIANVIVGIIALIPMTDHSPGCSFYAFLGMTAPMFSACIFCCMALNLQLVLVYGVNGNKMEKYYIIGSLLLCGVCNGTPWAAGQLGWYARTGVCWLKEPIPSVRLQWLVATQSIWMLLMSAVEVFSFMTILIFMVRHQMKIRRLRADSMCRSRDTSEPSIPLPEAPIVRYRGMIIRIGLYPLLSCFLSITECYLDVHSVVDTNTVLTHFELNLRIFDFIVYSSRPLLYTLLAATDPSFLRALRALRPSAHSPECAISWKQTATTGSGLTTQSQATLKLDENFTTTGGSAEVILTTEGVRNRRLSGEEEAEEIRAVSIGRQI
ncbi:hypothetical protein B0H16DRAFT_1892477 [Mycena metata]|uniref:Uncharacterized protein n=1 Tax=Mycena metata TaxID=1033252 RepID=A0AAD7I5I4_9AGAR|nr:hypothetical protein B0H16DRAFT_1892477 [Mycena metata]